MMTTSRHNAFTLVEVMLALLLASAVVGVTGIVAVQSVTLQRAARADAARSHDRWTLFDQFQTDVESTITWLPEGVEPLEIGAEANAPLRIYCLTSVPAPGSLGRYRMPARVTYRIEDANAGTPYKRLVREVEDLTEDRGSTYRRVVAMDLVDVVIETHTETGWSEPVTGEKRDAGEGDAVRLVCRFGDAPDNSMTRTVPIPGRNRTEEPDAG